MSSINSVIGQSIHSNSKFNKVNQLRCPILSSGLCVPLSLFKSLAQFFPLSKLEMDVFTMKILTSLLVIALMTTCVVPEKVHHESKNGKKKRFFPVV